MKKILVLGLVVFGLTVMFSLGNIFAQDKPKEQPKEVVMENERGFMFWVIGCDYPDLKYPGLNFKIIARDLAGEHKISSNLPDQPVKIISKMPPSMMEGWFSGDHNYNSNREEYKVILFAFGTEIPYEAENLRGTVDITYVLKLDPKFLKQEHFDILLRALRNHTPVEIEGHILDKSKDVELSKKDNRFRVTITMHPTLINSKKLY